MSKRAFAALPLRFNIPNDVKTITAVTQHQNQLFVAFDNLIISSCRLETQANLIFPVGSVSQIKMKKGDYFVKELRSLDNILFIFVKSKNSRCSLFMLPDKGQLNKIIHNIDCFAINRFTKDKFILTGADKTLSLHKFDGKNWSKSWSKDFPYQILAISLSYPNSFVLTTDRMYSVQIDTDKINNIPSKCIPEPYTMPVSHTSFFTYYAHSSMKIEADLSSNYPPVPFKDLAVDHAYNGSIFASVLPDNISLYDFERLRGRTYIENPKRITAFKDFFIISTDNRLYYLADITTQLEDIISGVVPENINAETLLAVFMQLWSTKRKDKAINMLRMEIFQEMVPSVLQIFDFFILPFNNTVPFMNSGKVDQNILNLLYTSLEAVQSAQIVSNEFINTAICQLLSKMNDHDKLKTFFETRPVIDQELMSLFYSKGDYSAHPYYLRYLGKIDEALKKWEEKNNFDEYCLTLMQKASDFDFIEKRIDVLIKNAPLKACDVLACDQISPQKSIALVRNKYPSIITPVLKRLVEHKDIIDREELANSFVTQMTNLISNLNDPNFDRSLVAFTNSVMNNPNASISEIENELSESFAEFIVKYRSLINLDLVLQNISKLSSLRLKIEIYKATGQINKSFEIIYKNDGNFEECENICFEEGNSETLHEFFLFVKSKMKPELFPNYVFNLITKFIKFVNIEKALSLIDVEAPIDSVRESIETTYSNINTTRMNSEMKAAFACSEEFESSYDRTILECRCVSLDSQSICSVCRTPLGYNFVQKTPDGKFCHYRCLASKKKST
ncbi:hypothetical protein TRFO_24437 [Tritrichomonas foetus]|uniref:Uncharacterized protein n=1 Tax=Tritrichomonas foetus TaxID=1144522 RepID=A0A1J4KCI2_9EUKA|nr:hypothetical protein TRFO_24437 [Tritrichomonas foetus]|eukprot:OHT07358.1 hypothetical protein TRFO_24437 [Tritrichomonas foetus]